jgi:hypothetical protein
VERVQRLAASGVAVDRYVHQLGNNLGYAHPTRFIPLHGHSDRFQFGATHF